MCVYCKLWTVHREWWSFTIYKLPRSQPPDGPVQSPLVLSEKLLRSLPLPQIRQRHGVRGEDSAYEAWAASTAETKNKWRNQRGLWAQPPTFSDLERLTTQMATASNSAGVSAASEAFRKCSADLIRGIQDPELLAWELYSDDVVSETVVVRMRWALWGCL